MRILIVEDELLIARFIARGLQSEGYVTATAVDGDECLRRLELEDWDLLLLDLRLPGRDGIAVLEEVSRRWPELPVLVVSARAGVPAKVAALDAGASDYLAKPFAFDELLARVRARLRRQARREELAPASPGFTLDGATRALVWGDGRRTTLSEREFELLDYLLRSPNTTVSRERILSAVWQYQFDPRSNVVDVYVGRLRRKLAPLVAIETDRGGYRLVTG